MARFLLSFTFLTILLLVPCPSDAHPAHDPPGKTFAIDPLHSSSVEARERFAQDTRTDLLSPRTTGVGALRFRLLHVAHSILPQEALLALERAHGGFAVDRREGRGEIYFALRGAGIIRIAPTLDSAELIDTPDVMRYRTLHNTSLWYRNDDQTFLTFPSVDGASVFTTTTDGALVHTLNTPSPAASFGPPVVNTYFNEGKPLIPTDVVYRNDMLYVTTGYSKLDYVLTARIESTDPFRARWGRLAFGGRGTAPGQFGTGHGITLAPDGETLVVSDRENSELDEFTLDGRYLRTTTLPKGSRPCDVDFAAGYALVACLKGPDPELGAPIYILKDREIVSTIMPKEDLGLLNFESVHNAVLVQRDGRLYIIALAWHPGDFAILEQVLDE
ncbi:MAG: hypothetical protein IID08_07985 [Candidatus Hydrogenedentes bacterium]|nr:hypothetical protein [Candidatus Hydrogenedentota bacterium]